MEIEVQTTVRSETGESEVVQVTKLNRSTLRADALGLSLAEARAVLAGLQQAPAERQAAELVARARRGPRCGQERACKGNHAIGFPTPFGKLTLNSPRLYRCGCESNPRGSFSPLAECLPERRLPELTYLETKFAALGVGSTSPLTSCTLTGSGNKKERSCTTPNIAHLRPFHRKCCNFW